MDTGLPTAVHTLLVVGAGAGDDLAAWRAQKPKRLVLVEPNPELARVLSKKIRAQAGEELITKACLARDANTAGLQILSMALESGLFSPAKALREFWPNLAVAKIIQVEAESICSLVSGLGLNPQENNALILDAPGAEAELLQALMASPDSKSFSTISVRTAPKPLYESGTCQETVEAALRSAFYDPKQAEESDVSPHVSLGFTLDTRAVLIAERDSKIALLEQQLRDLAKAKDQEIAALEQQTRELAQAKDEEITALRSDLAELSVAQSVLLKEKSDLLASRDTLTKEKSNLIAARDTLAKEKEDLAAQITQLVGQRESIRTELDQTRLANQKIQSAKAQLAQAKDQEIAGLGSEITQLISTRDTLLKEKADLLHKTQGLEKERAELISVRDSLAKEKSNLTAARDTLEKEKADLEAARDTITKEKSDLTAVLDTLTREKAELSANVVQLQSTNQELTARQALFNEELAKAEGQIELIKDLILRDGVRFQ